MRLWADRLEVESRIAAIRRWGPAWVFGAVLIVVPVAVASTWRGVDPIPQLVAAVMLALGLASSFVLYGTLMSPIGLFSMIWEAGLYLMALELVSYRPVTAEALAIMHGSLIAVIAVAAFVGPASSSAREVTTTKEIAALFIGLGTLGVAAALAEIAVKFGPLAVIHQTALLRTAITTGAVGSGLPAYLRLLMLPGAMLANRSRFLPAIALIGAGVYSFLSTERSYFFLVAAFFGVGVVFARQVRDVPRLLAVSVLTTVVGLALFVVAGVALGKQHLLVVDLARSSSSTVLPASLIGPYVYVTGGYVAFSVYISSVPPARGGIEAVVTPLTRITKGHKENVIYEFRKIPFDFNLYTYLRSWYDAAGVGGAVVGPALYSLVAAVAYRLRRRSVALYALACTTTVGMIGGIFNPYLTTIGFFFLIVLTVAVPIGQSATKAAMVGMITSITRVTGAHKGDDAIQSG